jgi:hypothetical protein
VRAVPAPFAPAHSPAQPTEGEARPIAAREAQERCVAEVPNCGMVVITDITVDVADIHPVNKRDVGRRLARWA